MDEVVVELPKYFLISLMGQPQREESVSHQWWNEDVSWKTFSVPGSVNFACY